MLINDLVELTLAPAGRKGGILLSAWRVIGTGPAVPPMNVALRGL
jgi:hypothetical protein